MYEFSVRNCNMETGSLQLISCHVCKNKEKQPKPEGQWNLLTGHVPDSKTFHTTRLQFKLSATFTQRTELSSLVTENTAVHMPGLKLAV